MHGSYIHALVDYPLSAVVTISKSPLCGWGSFCCFGFLEKTLPGHFITGNPKETYDHKKLANTRLLTAVELTVFLLSASLYYKNFYAKSKLTNTIRILGDFLALCNIIVAFDAIYHFSKKNNQNT